MAGDKIINMKKHLKVYLKMGHYTIQTSTLGHALIQRQEMIETPLMLSDPIVASIGRK